MLADADEFVRLRNSTDPGEYHRAAHDEASIDTWLEVISQHPDTRFSVAQNKTVPMEILARLARDDDSRVRSMVAMKRKLAAEILEILADDPSDAVRMSVACHRNTPRPVLESLSLHDPCPKVRRVAGDRL